MIRNKKLDELEKTLNEAKKAYIEEKTKINERLMFEYPKFKDIRLGKKYIWVPLKNDYDYLLDEQPKSNEYYIRKAVLIAAVDFFDFEETRELSEICDGIDNPHYEIYLRYIEDYKVDVLIAKHALEINI